MKELEPTGIANSCSAPKQGSKLTCVVEMLGKSFLNRCRAHFAQALAMLPSQFDVGDSRQLLVPRVVNAHGSSCYIACAA